VEGIDPFTEELPFVRIEMLVEPDVADRLVEYLNQKYGGYDYTVCAETVEVAPRPAT
jgi:hypothetical protein